MILPKNTSVGQSILKLRMALSLTQAALGEKIGVSRGAIAQFESGETVPSPTTLAKLSQVLDFDLSKVWQEPSSNSTLAREDFRLLPLFLIPVHDQLHRLIDPADEVWLHAGVLQVPVLRLPEIDYSGAAVLEIKAIV